jgi:hypothetical protein
MSGDTPTPTPAPATSPRTLTNVIHLNRPPFDVEVYRPFAEDNVEFSRHLDTRWHFEAGVPCYEPGHSVRGRVIVPVVDRVELLGVSAVLRESFHWVDKSLPTLEQTAFGECEDESLKVVEVCFLFLDSDLLSTQFLVLSSKFQIVRSQTSV